MTDLDQINIEVAKKLGWTITGECGGLKAFRNFKENEISEQEYIPAYSTDIRAAWEIVEYLKIKLGHKITSTVIVLTDGAQWYCHLQAPGLIQGVGDTAPIAICKAFLKLP